MFNEWYRTYRYSPNVDENQLEKFWRIWTHFAEKTPHIIIVSIQCFISIFHISMNIPEIATKKESLHISAKYDD